MEIISSASLRPEVGNVGVDVLEILGLGLVGGRVLLTGWVCASWGLALHRRRRRDLVLLWLFSLLFEQHVDERSGFNPEPEVDKMRAFLGEDEKR